MRRCCDAQKYDECESDIFPFPPLGFHDLSLLRPKIFVEKKLRQRALARTLIFVEAGTG
jgi:hypothetical protein